MAHGVELPMSAELKLYGTYVDNIFQTASPESDYISLSYLDASYDITSGASVFYNTNLNLFSEHSYLRSHNHYLGTEYEREISDGKGILHLGGKLGLRQNTPEYDPYDRREGNAYTGVKYYITDTIMARAGYSLGYESYPNYQTFSFLENQGFLQISKFLQSRTTLRLEVGAGRREYMNMDSDNNRDFANRITGLAKIAQSLTDNTGLQLQYLCHRASKDIVDGGYLEGDYYSIEDFFEDEYNYSGHEYRAVLKYLGPWRTILKGTINRENREYDASSLYNEDTERKDSDITILLEVEKKFSLPLGSFPDLALHIQFLHRDNNSSDPYYDYSASILSIGTKATF
jgi:hypothetical protein